MQARRAPRHVAPRAAELNFAFLTDVHVTPRGESDSLLRAAVAEINASAVDFVLVTGDLCNMGSDAELHCVHGILKRLRKPWFAVPGNHETTWSESACTPSAVCSATTAGWRSVRAATSSSASRRDPT